MSASSVWVTCGTFTHEACSRGPEMRLMRDSGTVSIGPNLAKSTTGIAGRAPPPATGALDLASAALTSSLVMRPFSPVPLIELRSMSSSRASRRTAGPAKTPEKSGFAGPAEVGGGEPRRRRPEQAAAVAGGAVGLGASAFAAAGGLGAASGVGACRVDPGDQHAHRDFVADLGHHIGDRAGDRRGHVHRRLVRFERHQRLVDLDRVARLHQHLDDRHILEVADVGDVHIDFRHRRISCAS